MKKTRILIKIISLLIIIMAICNCMCYAVSMDEAISEKENIFETESLQRIGKVVTQIPEDEDTPKDETTDEKEKETETEKEAEKEETETPTETPTGTGVGVGLPSLNAVSRPTAQGGTIIDVTNIILNATMVIGVILITVFIAITGFGMILGSAEEKAVTKEKFTGYLIAAFVLTGGAAIAKIIISVAESF